VLLPARPGRGPRRKPAAGACCGKGRSGANAESTFGRHGTSSRRPFFDWPICDYPGTSTSPCGSMECVPEEAAGNPKATPSTGPSRPRFSGLVSDNLLDHIDLIGL